MTGLNAGTGPGHLRGGSLLVSELPCTMPCRTLDRNPCAFFIRDLVVLDGTIERSRQTLGTGLIGLDEGLIDIGLRFGNLVHAARDRGHALVELGPLAELGVRAVAIDSIEGYRICLRAPSAFT